MKQVKGASTSLRLQILFMTVVTELVVVGLSMPHGRIRSKFAPSKVRSRFTPCPAGRPDLGFASYSTGRPWSGFAP